MKLETKRQKKLDNASKWLKTAREHDKTNEYPALTTAFYVLVAVEQLIEYLKMKEGE